MKMNIQFRRRSRGYVILLLTLIMAAVTLLILAGVMMRTSSVANLNMRSNQFALLNNAAEAATEKVFSRMATDFSAYGPGIVSNNLATYRGMYPQASDNPYWTNFVFSDAQGNTARTYVTLLTNYSGPLPTQYTNQYATVSPIYRIISNVSMPSSMANVVGTAQEDLMLALVPITTYAIFYNGELEFSDCATMIVSGRVHSNADICTGTPSSLTFNGGVTCCTTIQSPTRGGVSYSPMDENTTYNATRATNVVSVQISIPMTNTHTIVDIPPSGESVSSAIGQQREYNKAHVILIVTNSPLGGSPAVSLILQASYNGAMPGADTSPTTFFLTNCTPGYLATNAIVKLPFLSLTNVFGDQREGQTAMFVTQIDIGAYATWLSTCSAVSTKFSSGLYPTILYVADRRNIGSSQHAVVRLMDGQKLPPNTTSGGLTLGFSVATPNPLYVWGDYNTTTDGSHFANYVGGTTNGYSVPAALFSDALTILSSQWDDSKSNSGYTGRNTVKSNMTVNAAIITGNIPSTGTSATTFSGGVHNLTRMLENWGSVTLTYNTSIICLFSSQMATHQFLMPYSGSNPSGYYTPPTRKWGFDITYYDPNKQPPGVPCALVPIRYNWTQPAPNSLVGSTAY